MEESYQFPNSSYAVLECGFGINELHILRSRNTGTKIIADEDKRMVGSIQADFRNRPQIQQQSITEQSLIRIFHNSV